MKHLLFLVLMFACPGLMAEWTLVSSDEEVSNYLDFATIRKSGNKVKFWELSDYKAEQHLLQTTYLSTKSQGEINCNDEVIRPVAIVYYSGNMGKVKVVNNFVANTIEWSPIAPGTLAEVYFKLVCGKKY